MDNEQNNNLPIQLNDAVRAFDLEKVIDLLLIKKVDPNVYVKGYQSKKHMDQWNFMGNSSLMCVINAPIGASSKENQEKRERVARLLLEFGADPDKKSETKNQITPIMRAATRGKTHILNVLLDYTKNINAKDGEGNTALSRAFLKDRYSSVDVLLERGADINVRNNKGLNLIEEFLSQRHYENSKRDDLRLHYFKKMIKDGININTSIISNAYNNGNGKYASFLEKEISKRDHHELGEITRKFTKIDTKEKNRL